MSEELAPLRVVARRAVARTLRSALDALVGQGHKSATQRAVAKRLDVSHTHLARLLVDGSPAVAAGDIAAMGSTVERAYLLARLAEIDSSADGSVRSTLDRVTVELGAATSALIADVAADGREDEHLRHAAALEKIAGIALRGAGAAKRRAEEGR